MTEERCYQCGGELEVEIAGDFRDLVCQQCGIIVDSEEEVAVEDQEAVTNEGEYEIVE